MDTFSYTLTDGHGAIQTAAVTVTMVEVTDWTLERETADGTWENVPDGEISWSHDNLRWTATFGPKNPPDVQGIDWLAKPWDQRDDPEVPWEVFASSSTDVPAEGNPGPGEWAITPLVQLSAPDQTPFVVAMAQPKQKVVAKIQSVKWVAHSYDDGLSTFYEGNDGAITYPERLDPIGEVHDLVDVEITITPVIPNQAATVYLRVFDPDHDSSIPDFDTNGDVPDDNVLAGGAQAQPGASLGSTELTFLPGTTTARIELAIDAKQPGNNFVVVASGRQEWLQAYLFNDDGVTLIDPLGGQPLPENVQTRQLTVWRTLNVEQDSMGAPASTEYFDPPGSTLYDQDPQGDIGTRGLYGTDPGSGVFAQPSLDWLAAQMERAHLTVKTLQLADGDMDDNATFVHNMTQEQSRYAANPVRNIEDEADYWVIQVFAAYEYMEEFDGDEPFLPVQEDRVLGNTFSQERSAVNIYLETIRDTSEETPGAKSPSVIAQRAVLHETMHRFGYSADDIGPMNQDNVVKGSDEDNELPGALLRQVITANRPTTS